MEGKQFLLNEEFGISIRLTRYVAPMGLKLLLNNVSSG